MSFGRFKIESNLIIGMTIILVVWLLANKFLNIIASWVA